MALVRYNPIAHDLFPSFSNLVDNFFGKDFPVDGNQNAVPAVNIRENDGAFELELAAPGLKKEDFNVELDDNVLKISLEKEDKQEEKDEQGNYTRREFSYHAFKRAFTLPENADEGNIKAEYQDGILKLNIPKRNAEEVKASKRIEIS